MARRRKPVVKPNAREIGVELSEDIRPKSGRWNEIKVVPGFTNLALGKETQEARMRAGRRDGRSVR